MKSPGRVNLIGEHIDYAGLSVFPMAVERQMIACFRRRSDSIVRLMNVEARFSPREFTLSSTIEPSAGGDWANYAKASGQELFRHFGPLQGFDALVSSDLPVAAGLSSSSALVIACALMLVQVNGISVGTLELAELMARAERYAGPQGGGMDQAICLGARKNTASVIDFHPLRLTPVTVPDEWRFIVAASLVQADKAGAALKEYNRRTRECAEALSTVIESLGLAGRIDSYGALLAHRTAEDLSGEAEQTLEGDLRKRFRHVVKESDRVKKAESAMTNGDRAGFGRLMSESHLSLRHDFEVSCAELDELVDIAQDAGAEGARLTGAGFGGCVIALCHETRMETVLTALTERFYSKRRFEGSLEDQLFVARPSEGASVSSL